MMEYLIVTSGIILATLLILFITTKNITAKWIIGAFLVMVMILLAKSTLDNKEHCRLIINESISLNETHTAYTYGQYCIVDKPETANLIFKLSMYLVQAGILLVGVMSIWWLFIWFKKRWGV